MIGVGATVGRRCGVGDGVGSAEDGLLPLTVSAQIPSSPQVLAQTTWAYEPEHCPVARTTSQSACEKVFVSPSHEGMAVGVPDGATYGA